MKKLRRVAQLLSWMALPCLLVSALAQTPEVRLQHSLSGDRRLPLLNSHPPVAALGADLGNLAPDTQIAGITLVFKRSAAQEALLGSLLAAQLDPGSPLFHHWLTPESFASRFGVAEEDIATTQAWLRASGFHIAAVTRGRDRITFSGTAAQVDDALGAQLHRYRGEGDELRFAPAVDLSLPAELLPVTAAVLHLSTFRPKPTVRAVQPRPNPDYTVALTGAHYLTPRDIATMYDLPPLYNAGFVGSGQTLAVVGQSFVDLTVGSPVNSFQPLTTQADPPSSVLVANSGVEAISPGDAGESEIDLEYASGIAYNAKLLLIYTGSNPNYNVFDAFTAAITENVAPVVSVSYGVCESLLSASEITQYNALFEEAASQGQTLVAAAGDSGSTGCAPFAGSSGVTLAQQQALAVDFPADSPYVTGVGGTQMAPGTFTNGSSPYWAPAGTSDIVGSLQSYVPEVAWNEGSPTRGIIAGGGGASTLFPRPAWQTGVPGITAGAYRLLPDIALQASILSPGFLICTDDRELLNAQGQTSSCNEGLVGSNNQFTIAGGTSFAAPVFAGFLAVMNQVERATGLGNVNPVLYSVAANSAAGAFHDITAGSNACMPGAGTCAAPGQSGFAAAPGYDEATGLGSVDFNQLAAAWPGAATRRLALAYVEVDVPVFTTPAGSSVPISLVIAPAYDPQNPHNSTVPTGQVTVYVDGVAAGPALQLSTLSGTPATSSGITAGVTFSYLAPAISGSHLITAAYAGDATYAPATSSGTITVGSLLAVGTVSLSAPNLTVANGAVGTTRVNITPSGGYNGRLTWSLQAVSGTGALSACYSISSLPISQPTSTGLTIGVGTACNAPPTPQFKGLDPSAPRIAAKTPGSPPKSHRGPMLTFAGLLFGGLLACRRNRERLLLVPSIVLLAFLSLGLSGCGGGHSNAGTPTPAPTTPAPAPAVTYTLTLTGKDSVNGAISAATSFTLTVQ